MSEIIVEIPQVKNFSPGEIAERATKMINKMSNGVVTITPHSKIDDGQFYRVASADPMAFYYVGCMTAELLDLNKDKN